MLSRGAVGDEACTLGIEEALEISLECFLSAGKGCERIGWRGNMCGGEGPGGWRRLVWRSKEDAVCNWGWRT
jgi:hypothetical protein